MRGEGPVGISRDRIRCVAFDAVGTLVRAEPSVADAYHVVGRAFGTRLDRDTIRSRFADAFAASERMDMGAGTGAGIGTGARLLRTDEERERARWRFIVRQVLDDVADLEGAFAALWEHFARPASWRCYADAGPTLARLAAQGIPTAIASNFDARLIGLCDGLDELRGIGVRIVSSLIGSRKPAAEFFLRTAAECGCRPEEVLFVGDDWENDVLGARAAGLPTAWIVRGAEEACPAPEGSEAVWRIGSLEEIADHLANSALGRPEAGR